MDVLFAHVTPQSSSSGIFGFILFVLDVVVVSPRRFLTFDGAVVGKVLREVWKQRVRYIGVVKCNN